MIASVLQYMYELEYKVDNADEKVPNISHHACVWYAGDMFGIKGLKVVAAEKFGLALSQYNIYGTEVDLTFSFFENFVKDVETTWDELPRSNRALRGQVSMHIQSNIKVWPSKEGTQARLVESFYRLIFREIQEQTLDPGPVLRVIQANYQEYLDAETGYAALEKDCGVSTFDNVETEDAPSEKDCQVSTFDNAETGDTVSEEGRGDLAFDNAENGDAASEKDGGDLTFDNAGTGDAASDKGIEASTFDVPEAEDVPSDIDSKFDDADVDWV